MTDNSTFEQYFPFLRLGLTKNPFGTLTAEETVAATVPPRVLQDAVNRGFDHIQIIGERGRGKSTALHWLCDHFQTKGESVVYERLPRWQFDYHTDITHLDCFALDEAQRLFVLNQGQLFRQAQGKRLIIGTHISWERAFRRHGWQLLTIQIGKQTTREHMQHILDRRLMVFASRKGVQIYFDDSAVDYLWDCWRDNLRGMEFFLYHIIQKRREVGAITANYLETAGADYVEPAGLY